MNIITYIKNRKDIIEQLEEQEKTLEQYRNEIYNLRNGKNKKLEIMQETNDNYLETIKKQRKKIRELNKKIKDMQNN